MCAAPEEDAAEFAALVGGYASFAAMEAAVTPEIAENGVSITGVVFGDDGSLEISWAVESTVAAKSEGGLFATSKTVDLPYFLKFKASLADQAWTTVYSGTLTIDGSVSSGSATFDLSAALEEAGIEGGSSAGFFTLSVGE